MLCYVAYYHGICTRNQVISMVLFVVVVDALVKKKYTGIIIIIFFKRVLITEFT